MSTLATLIVEKCAQAPDRVAMHARHEGVWKSQTWRECERHIASTASALRRLGIGPGDRVAILGNPDPRWLNADFATLCLGGIGVGIYPTLLPDAIAWQIRHSGAKLLISERPMEAPCPVVSWDLDGEPDVAALHADAARVKPGDDCAIFYTSGTTGDPKGAVVTHGAMLATCRASREALPIEPGDRSIVFLPLAHSLQRMVSYRGLMDDVTAYFCASLDQFAETLLVARPQVLASVPRLLEKIKAGAETKVAQQSPVAQRIFAWAMAVGRERSLLAEQGRPIPPWLALRLQVADRLVYRKVRARFGGEVRTFCCGGAKLDTEVARFFHALGIDVFEAWGLTETCAPATLNRTGDFRFGTVGRPLPGMELRLDTDGEVLVRGPGLFRGYWQDPVATEAAFDRGWFRTGDIGTIEDGFLRIVDRKKEILVTSGGKNIPPVNIEKKLEGGAVGQAVVIGDDRPYLVALLAPDPDVPCADRPGYAAERVAAVNATLAPYEQIKKWAWLDAPLSVEAGTLTPTLKLKRRVIASQHASAIAALYANTKA